MGCLRPNISRSPRFKVIDIEGATRGAQGKEWCTEADPVHSVDAVVDAGQTAFLYAIDPERQKPIVSPVHFHVMHRIRDVDIRDIDIICQAAVIGACTQLVARATAVELNRQDYLSTRIQCLQQGDVISGRHTDRVGIEIEAGAIPRFGVGHIATDEHKRGIGERRLQAVTAGERRTRADVQVTTIIRICCPSREIAAFKAILEDQVRDR